MINYDEMPIYYKLGLTQLKYQDSSVFIIQDQHSKN